MYSPLSLTQENSPTLPHYNYKLRVVVSSLVSNTYKESLLALAKELKGSFIFAMEVGKKTEKQHFHGAFSTKTKRRDTVALMLKKFLKFDPNITKLTNSHWSLTLDEEPETWHRYECYLTKEQNIICSTFSEKEIGIMYSEYQTEADKIKIAQRSVINKKQRIKVVDRDTVYNNIVEKIEKQNLLKEIEDIEFEVDDRFKTYPEDCKKSDYPTKKHYAQCATGKELKIILSYVIEEFNTGETYYSLSQLEPITNRLMSRYFPEVQKVYLANNLINRLIRSN